MSKLQVPRVAAVLVGLCALLALTAVPALAALPDGRVWEQVSPVNKNGADIASTFGTPFTGVAVSTSGDRAVYFAATPFDGTPNGIITTFYRGTRSTTGWSTNSISYQLPYTPGGLDIEFAQLFSPDLSTGIVTTPFGYDANDNDGKDLGHFPITGWEDQYWFGGPSPVWISHGDVLPDSGHFESFLGWASNDLSRVAFGSQEDMIGGLPTLSGGFYVYENSGGQTQLINVDNSGDLINAPYGATIGDRRFNGGFEDNAIGNARNAVSADGSKVFFESPAPNSGSPDPVKLYMRDTVAGTTTRVSQPDTNKTPTDDAFFAGASDDASKVFFTTTEQLNPDDTDADNDVYIEDTATGALTRVSGGNTGTDDANVAGVAAVSNDGTAVYFVAMNQLTGLDGTTGEPNLYRYDTTTGTTAFVATLSGSDSNVWSPHEAAHPAFTTPDGNTLAFLSVANLTPYDAQGHSEVYVYHTSSGTVACASCHADNSPPTGDADFGFQNDWGFSFGWVKPLSDDGQRVFFQTTDTLVPEDVNGSLGNPLDVYEYAGGVQGLISDGASKYGSQLAGVSRSGNDVFFYTRSALAPSDVDGGELDVYDARVGGGFPPAAAPPAPCDGEACKGAPAAAPFLPVPVTTAPTEGNVVQRPGVRATFSVAGISRAAAARAARTGRLVLRVHVSASGRIVAAAFARIGGKSRRVARASHRFGGPGSARMTLKLSKAAMAKLRRSGRLRLRIDVTYSRGGKRTAHVTLRRSSR